MCSYIICVVFSGHQQKEEDVAVEAEHVAVEEEHVEEEDVVVAILGDLGILPCTRF